MMETSRKYETIIIFKATISDDERAQEIDKIKEILNSCSCTDLEIEDWGKREVVYGLHTRPSGHYVCFNYSSPEFQVNDKLTEALMIVESVVKFQTHRLNEKARKFKGRVSSKPKAEEAAA